MKTYKNKEQESFNRRVRETARAIPRGSVMTYKGIAVRAGNPKAARAVARIMSRNYDPTIPCHRVIRSDGSLGGYNRGGEAAKRKLLNQEKNHDRY